MTRTAFRGLATTIILALAIHAPVLSQSVTEGRQIKDILTERDREIKSILEQEPLSAAEEERLETLINESIRFDVMGQTALGPHWEKISEDQRSEFVDVFSEVVREQSLSDLEPYRAAVTITDVSVAGDSAVAVTSAIYKDVTTEVIYDLLKIQDEWWIIDITLDGVSTAEGYARSFQSAIRKRGFDGLMNSLRKRLERSKG